MAYSVISQNGFLVEVKDRRIFVNGSEVCQDQIKESQLRKIYIMVGVIAGFLAGGFSGLVISNLIYCS